MNTKTINELEFEYGNVDGNYIYLTNQSIKELSEGSPIHCESVILITSLPKEKE